MKSEIGGQSVLNVFLTLTFVVLKPNRCERLNIAFVAMVYKVSNAIYIEHNAHLMRIISVCLIFQIFILEKSSDSCLVCIANRYFSEIVMPCDGSLMNSLFLAEISLIKY